MVTSNSVRDYRAYPDRVLVLAEMNTPIINSVERNQIVRWWFDQQDDLTKAELRDLSRQLIEGVRRNSHGRQSLGELGALELLYCLSRWQNGGHPDDAPRS